MSTSSFLAGFITGLSLIIAIGAQNAFVLRQGLRREHVAATIMICVASDMVLIASGVLGLGVLVQQSAWLQMAARYGGAAFLLVYGLLAARRACSHERLEVGGEGAGSLKSAVLACLGFTWLNPHVYLDTVVLLGSIANQRSGQGPLWFGAGAGLASLCWFVGLGLGARLLTPLFARERSWRMLDSAVAVMMLGMGVGLVAG
ncbi:LysE/ArgO family amino acid transporter [Paludibacterium yongneupense]|uniref:LysE/ArgO family amino acid transporter n=1 Tax=Paludibacterium yongneupense TaxID=400061 RepID=UPI00040F8D28|nr:LysE/ArgO family amino acid transporter [Paludibacterium yongneupense]